MSEYPSNPAPAVGAVVIHRDQVLLVRRKKAPSQGIWAIPGGRVELGESLAEAAEREVMEETGIEIRAGKPCYCFDSIHHDAEGRVRYHYVIVDLVGEYLSGEPVANDDALEARWVSRSTLARLNVSKATLDLLSDQFSFGAESA